MRSNWKSLLVAGSLLLNMVPAAIAQEDEQGGGEPGMSSPGSPGMEDSEPIYRNALRKAEKGGKRTRAYIDALTQLGMHYNRQNRFADASKTLREALALMDSGVLKPVKVRVPEKQIEKVENGTASVQVIRQPMPYEETMEGLLPQLVTAELGANQLPAAETHVKRLIAFKGTNDVADKVNLMSAYSMYSEICRKLHREKEAQEYKHKAEAINASFKPL